MHRKSYIHRDVKPENIGFLKKNDLGSLKILNFLTVKKVNEGELLYGLNGSVRTFSINKNIVIIHGT